MTTITIGYTASGDPAVLHLNRANRHGLITGSTGGGKTVSLQALAEGFSRNGIPVFMADIKGDLSGLAAAGPETGFAADRAASMGYDRKPTSFPCRFWDLFGETGMPMRTSVHEMGPLLMSRLLGLNEVQEGVMSMAWKKAKADDDPFLHLRDLASMMDTLLEEKDDLRSDLGHITNASVGAIRRGMNILEGEGGDHLFGEPGLDIMRLLDTATDGRGIVNLLDATVLMDRPRMYGTFLLFLLSRLFETLPEVGDIPQPKLVFFFDEAHLLFKDAGKRLLEMIERLVRLVRSKGVGVYFVTQSPADVPDSVLAQLGNRVQHALRAFTPKDLSNVRKIAKTYRPNPKVKVEEAITTMEVGEALVSMLQPDGTPAMVERVRIVPPAAQIGPIGDYERSVIVKNDPLLPTFDKPEPDDEIHATIAGLREHWWFTEDDQTAYRMAENRAFKDRVLKPGWRDRIGGPVAAVPVGPEPASEPAPVYQPTLIERAKDWMGVI